MLLLKDLLLGAGIAMFVVAVGILTYDLYLLIVDRHVRLYPAGTMPLPPVARWRTSIALTMLAWSPLLISAAIVIVLSGTPRVSQTAIVERQMQTAVGRP